MNREELVNRLTRYEWSDVEFKEARTAAPKTAYETVSAFANTAGGWLVFGVRDRGGAFEVVGVDEVDKVQGEFLSTLRSGKVNRTIDVGEQAIGIDGRTLLVFHVPESPRHEKPICLDGDVRKSFIRRGGCDERCRLDEIQRFLRDSAPERFDAQPVDDLDAGTFYDPASLDWYRRRFDERRPGAGGAPSPVEFLHEWGFVVERGGRLVPVLAAVLLLGRPRHLRRALRRPVVDCQFINAEYGSWTTDQRWFDRVVVEENLVQAWFVLAERYDKHADHPFRLDPATLRRDDDPPDYVPFREAAINLLIHQDYGDWGRKASIRFFRDRIVFWNPGDAFAATDELLNPTEKQVRNPALVDAFRRIGLSEQAGTGMRAIFRNWQSLGHVPPVIENDKAKKAFELNLLREELLDEKQRRLQARLGVRLDDAQARLFALACRRGGASITDAKAVSGGAGPEARKVLDGLVVQGLLQAPAEGVRYRLAEHVKGRAGSLNTDQVSENAVHLVSDHVYTRSVDWGSDQVGKKAEDLVTDQVRARSVDLVTDPVGFPRPDKGAGRAARTLTDRQRRIIAACDMPRSLAELMAGAGMTHRTFFRRTHLQPLLDGGLVRMTNPDKPRAANQRYVLTEAGVALEAARLRTARRTNAAAAGDPGRRGAGAGFEAAEDARRGRA